MATVPANTQYCKLATEPNKTCLTLHNSPCTYSRDHYLNFASDLIEALTPVSGRRRNSRSQMRVHKRPDFTAWCRCGTLSIYAVLLSPGILAALDRSRRQQKTSQVGMPHRDPGRKYGLLVLWSHRGVAFGLLAFHGGRMSQQKRYLSPNRVPSRVCIIISL